jgi:hypothetical protein
MVRPMETVSGVRFPMLPTSWGRMEVVERRTVLLSSGPVPKISRGRTEVV